MIGAVWPLSNAFPPEPTCRTLTCSESDAAISNVHSNGMLVLHRMLMLERLAGEVGWNEVGTHRSVFQAVADISAVGCHELT